MHRNKSNGQLIAEWALTILALLTLAYVFGSQCSREKKVIRVIEPGKGEPVLTCENEKLGTVRELECNANEVGTIIEACEETGWVERYRGCQPKEVPPPVTGECGEDELEFADLVPLLQDNCQSCHQSYVTYDVFRTKLDESVRRMRLDSSSPLKMPRGLDMTDEEITKFETWRNDGARETCDTEPTDPGKVERALLDLDYVEAEILGHINRLDQRDRVNARYLVMSHRYDFGDSDADLDTARAGIHKSVNSISNDRRLKKLQPIDRAKTIYYADLDDYELERADWDLIEAADRVNFESFTSQGGLIKLLAQTRKPWLHMDNFTFLVNQADTYYSLLDIEDRARAFFDQIDSDFFDDFDDLETTLMAFNGSPISLNKNRAMSRHEIDDGYLWVTYDPIDPTNSPERNIFDNPIPPFSNLNEKEFLFDAAEMIWQLPNGLQGYILFNNQGVRQNAAPLNIVADNRTPFSPEIKNALSCHRCHSVGLIIADDQIRDHVFANSSEFGADVTELVDALYRPRNENIAAFREDIGSFNSALEQIGVNINEVDPISFSVDKIRKDWSLEEVAAYLFFSADDFKNQLQRSGDAKAQVGQLLTGGRITLAQLLETLPVIIEDLRIGQDPLVRSRGN